MLAWAREERRPTWLSFFFERTKKTDFLLPTNELQNAASSLGSRLIFRVVFLYFVCIICFGVFTSCMFAWASKERRPMWFTFVLKRTKKTDLLCFLQVSCEMQHPTWGLSVGQVDPCGCWDGSFDPGIGLDLFFTLLTLIWTPLNHGFGYFY